MSAAGAVRLLGGANSTDEVPEDAAVSQNLDAMRGPLEAMDEEGVGAAAVLLNGARADVRSKETNLADLICDAMFRYIDASTGLLAAAPDAPVICLLNGGGIRASIAAGNVSYGGARRGGAFVCAAKPCLACAPGRRAGAGQGSPRGALARARSPVAAAAAGLPPPPHLLHPLLSPPAPRPLSQTL